MYICIDVEKRHNCALALRETEEFYGSRSVLAKQKKKLTKKRENHTSEINEK